MKNTEKAFHWIIDILEKHNIAYKITGGFAARVYGVDRELADIDIEVADSDVRAIQEEVASYVVFGPARYVDADWDLELMTLNYEGQEIDIAGNDAKIFNKQNRQWEDCFGDLTTVEMKEVFGKVVPVESRETLVAYKKKLGRAVDVEDVRQLTTSDPNTPD